MLSKAGVKAAKRVNLQDVADAAGVSSATVSMVLRGKGGIADETRERVKKAALDLNYIPQRTRDSRFVAILEYESCNVSRYPVSSSHTI